MRKWCLLAVTFAAWMTAGHVLCATRPFGARTGQPQTHRPTRIVSMAPDLTETLYAMGLEQRIAAVSSDSDFPPQASDKPKVGTFWQPNIEAVIAVRPDLVVTQVFNQQQTIARRLRRMGYACLALDIERMNDLFTAVEIIGDATGQRETARNLVDTLQGRMVRLADLVKTSKKVRVLWVVQREPLRVAGLDTFVNGIIELAGGQNAIGPTLQKYPPIGGEQVLACGVEAIIEPMMTGSDPNAQQQAAMAYWSRFASLPAVVNGRIYVIDGDIVSRLSPRLCDGAEAVARCLHPEAFAR
jgi:iron complex transport system substrate-binding protein